MTKNQAWRSNFGESSADAKKTWDRSHEKVHYEMSLMMAEFHTWCTKERHETEDNIINVEHHLASYAPFARAGLDSAETPAKVPLVVFEFADYALDLMELKRRMGLLDVYYKQAGNWSGGQEFLQIEPGNESEINTLWEWFMEERAESAGKGES